MEIHDKHRNSWIDFAQYIGAEFLHLSSFHYGYGVLYKHYNWQILMETYRTKDSLYGTQIHMPFIPKTEFVFHIYEGKRLGTFSKLKGEKDHLIGDKQFDSKYILLLNDVKMVNALLDKKEIKELFYKIPQANLKIKKQIFNTDQVEINGQVFVDFFHSLSFKKEYLIIDTTELFHIFKLLTYLMDQLVSIGAAEAIAPDITLVDEDLND